MKAFILGLAAGIVTGMAIAPCRGALACALTGKRSSGTAQNSFHPENTRHEHPGSRRDPEERTAEEKAELREKMLDKTLADSFPTSDPPSSIPDPGEDDSLTA